MKRDDLLQLLTHFRRVTALGAVACMAAGSPLLSADADAASLLARMDDLGIYFEPDVPIDWGSDDVASAEVAPFGILLAQAEGDPVAAPEPVADPVEIEAAETPGGLTGHTYTVSGLDLRYLQKVEGTPSIQEIQATPIELGVLDGAYVAPERARLRVTTPLRDLPGDGPSRFHHTALNSIGRQVVDALNRRGLGAVIVAPDEADIDFTTARDLRSPDKTRLSLTVFLPTVREIQTFASGNRIGQEESTNNPAHARILENSPVQAGQPFRPRDVEEYLARLNRHPGRKVAAQLSPSRETGRVYLDYQIAESRPWRAYAQYQNTGTESTTEHQERFGFVNYQLSDRDDILTLDYVTGNFDEVDAVLVSYDTPVPLGYENQALRVALTGSFSSYDADADSGFPSRFEGDQFEIGLDFTYNAFQYRDTFVDVFAGARYEVIHADNKTASISGRDQFFLPHVGLGLERTTDDSRARASLSYEWNNGALAHTESSEIANLGRLRPDKNFEVLRWDASGSIFIESLLNRGFRDQIEPRFPTRAHELFVWYRGQDALGNRLIPQHQQIAGGFHTVRGYDQGATAGDDVHVATFEYRFHLPRAFTPRSRPSQLPLIGEFAVAPRYAGGRADWDLIFRTFYDVARVKQTDRIGTEFDDRLRAWGVGLELLFMDRLSVRFDWARGLDDARGGAVSDGSEGHVAVTLFY